MQFLTQDTPEWNRVWDALIAITGSESDENPRNGEVWQYMGSFNGNHEFRHRERPATAAPIAGETHIDRVNLHIDAKTLTLAAVGSRRYVKRCCSELGPRQPMTRPKPRPEPRSDTDYGGTFDGFSVSSDADPGL